MIFTDQDVIVLDAEDNELDMGTWSDELDNLARDRGGYVVVINSEPAIVYADYRHRTTPDGRTDHSTCSSWAHDRSLPDNGGRAYGDLYDENGFLSDKQVMSADGLLGCNDCGRPLFYCRNDEWYFHVDPDAGCFLSPAWGTR